MVMSTPDSTETDTYALNKAPTHLWSHTEESTYNKCKINQKQKGSTQ